MNGSYQPPAKPLERLLFASESLRHLARTIPEAQGGLAHLMNFLGEEVQACATLIEDKLDDLSV